MNIYLIKKVILKKDGKIFLRYGYYKNKKTFINKKYSGGKIYVWIFDQLPIFNKNITFIKKNNSKLSTIRK